MTPIEVDLREEGTSDAGKVAEVHRRVFGDRGEVVARLVEDLRRASATDCVSLVAEHGGRVVGHALFTRALLDAEAGLVAVSVLSPLAVIPECQRAGVGASLIRRGLRTLTDRGVPAVFLEGDPDYYGRFGFMPAGSLGFRKPSLRIPDLAFQVHRLPAYAVWMTGTLVYPDPFWRHDAVGLRGLE